MTETAKAPVRCGLSGTALKYIACITMLIDHIGASCIEAGILLPALPAAVASRSAPCWRQTVCCGISGGWPFPSSAFWPWRAFCTPTM